MLVLLELFVVLWIYSRFITADICCHGKLRDPEELIAFLFIRPVRLQFPSVDVFEDPIYIRYKYPM